MIDTSGMMSERKWQGNVVLTFGFPEGSDYDQATTPEVQAGFKPFSEPEKVAVRAILAEVASFTNLNVAEADGSAAEVRYGRTNDTATAHAYYPGSMPNSGDVWLRASDPIYDHPVTGGHAYYILLHETGHALGLKHPHETNSFSVALPEQYDRVEYSVMSYTQRYFDIRPQGFMAMDIAALQKLYGADYGLNAGDTVYKITTGVRAIWDGGGNDTLDFSGVVRNALTGPMTISLVPGEISRNAVDSLVIGNAFLFNDDPRSTIENVVGTRKGDSIIGNDADNRIAGGGGNDLIRGGLGADTFIFNMIGKKHADTILDFKTGVDQIVLDGGVFKKLNDNGVPKAKFFAIGKADDGNDYLIYKLGSGKLLYDKDGGGGKDGKIIATFVGGLDTSDILTV